MASNRIVAPSLSISTTRAVVFAGDNVTLAGQIDYPASRRPAQGYPLVFILHHACCNMRDDYVDYAQVALDKGFAVFRWDKRGTGHSGSSGRGSTTQDAVNAYETALSQPNVNRRAAVILAVGSGTALLGSSFGLFARVQRPQGAILVANMLNDTEVLAIDTQTLILMGEQDWNPAAIYGDAASAAHRKAYRHGAAFRLICGADRLLMSLNSGGSSLHPDARKAIGSWLNSLTHPSTSS